MSPPHLHVSPPPCFQELEKQEIKLQSREVTQTRSPFYSPTLGAVYMHLTLALGPGWVQRNLEPFGLFDLAMNSTALVHPGFPPALLLRVPQGV